MNRLVIIGNGFDLAHGLPTGYSHFINWYWRKVCEGLRRQDKFDSKYEDEFISIAIEFMSQCDIRALEAFESLDSYNSLIDLLNNLNKNSFGGINFGCSFKYKNSFFESICDKNHIQNWVDIENEYYLLLKDCLKEKDNARVKKLNEAFEQVKKLLEKYLATEVEEKFDLSVNREVVHLLSNISYDRETQKALFKEIERSAISDIDSNLENFKVHRTLLLSFNYTSLSELYTNTLFQENVKGVYAATFAGNQIHGILNTIKNPIIFGFGDEMDDDYKTIEKKDDNEYLRNIKSFAYLNTPNYRSIINFIEAYKFQVYIMGHSCGLSDRILLNKVFEHKNCISIKIYYYQNGDWDNYTDIAQNVSRHFNKKEMMRERIVNKTYCEPLPQTKLPLKDTSAS